MLLGLGGCAVDEDGCALTPGKMKQDQMRIELREAGVPNVVDMGKKELTAAVKVCECGWGGTALRCACGLQLAMQRSGQYGASAGVRERERRERARERMNEWGPCVACGRGGWKGREGGRASQVYWPAPPCLTPSCQWQATLRLPADDEVVRLSCP